MDFNNKQLEAINHYEGACGVIAGAGSGKSTVLINRIKTLVEKHRVPERDILIISFTSATAKELKAKLNGFGLTQVKTGTFHAICRDILSKSGYLNGKTLIPEYKREQAIVSKETKLDTEAILSFIGYQKNYLKSVTDEFEHFESEYTQDELRRFYRGYESFKDKNHFYDHEDTLIEALRVLEKKKIHYTFPFLLVDEHQDSNLVQNELIKHLCPSRNIMCVQDYRQAIYGFRGSNPEFSMNFDKEYPGAKIINLDINYRSPANVVDKANHFIKRYYGDFKHYSDSIAHLKDRGIISKDVFYSSEEEGLSVAEKIESLIGSGEDINQIAVLFRNNSQVSNVEYELKLRNISYYNAKGGSFFKRREIAAIISYLRLISNPHDDVAFDSVFRFRNYPIQFFSNKLYNDIKSFSGVHNLSIFETLTSPEFKYDKPFQRKNAKEFCDMINNLRKQYDKGISVTTMIDNLIKAFKFETYIYNNSNNKEELEDKMKSLSLLKSFVKNNNLEQFINFTYSNKQNKHKEKDSVKLMTVHGSKGLEYKHVFLIGVEDGKFPSDKSDILEEARLFYVAVTRPKENLYVSEIGRDNQFVKEYFN
ncbi:ATP-dependent helicase [Cytobacillus kochii]|uniref:ATP-dependent helicase n=1 Tax=Cytobacillus kochii TaxID=859143 RepID=UPI001CD53CA8|nr:ATP-dependent helicase [Cytobacillus kochii]MCA1025704.1 ATP-dependent helicase [Cytobacillus kochii]